VPPLLLSFSGLQDRMKTLGRLCFAKLLEGSSLELTDTLPRQAQ